MRTAVVFSKPEKVLRMGLKAQSEGGEPNFANGCEQPVRIVAMTARLVGHATASCIAPCRKCPTCLNRRRRMWAARAATEISLANRTWFVTLTARPEVMGRWLKAIGEEYRPGIGRELSPAQYGRMARLAYRDVQLWKKRLARDNRGLRFLFTVERHTGKRSIDAWGRAGMGDFYGLPHFHAFVHETSSECRYSTFKKAARSIGFFSAKLVPPGDMKTVWYVVKYLTKDHGLKIWPSFRYGRLPAPDTAADEKKTPQ